MKQIKAVGHREIEELRKIRAEHISKIKTYKEVLPKDVIFEAEKNIHDLFTANSKALNDAVANKVKQAESH